MQEPKVKNMSPRYITVRARDYIKIVYTVTIAKEYISADPITTRYKFQPHQDVVTVRCKVHAITHTLILNYEKYMRSGQH